MNDTIRAAILTLPVLLLPGLLACICIAVWHITWKRARAAEQRQRSEGLRVEAAQHTALDPVAQQWHTERLSQANGLPYPGVETRKEREAA